MERESSSRPKSRRPPSVVPVPRTAAMVSAASRPITQQGLSGLRPAQTPSAGANRIYRDKRYYMSMVQTHMNTIKDEITRLEKSSAEHKVIALNSQEYRRQAEESAKKLAEQQELLNVYNTVLDIHLSRAKVDQIHSETTEIRKKNETALKELESIFNYKVKYEEQLAAVTKELEEEDRQAEAAIDKMTIEEREEYMDLKSRNDKFVEDIRSTQAYIEECKEVIEVHKEAISKSKNKQKKLQLLETYRRLKAQAEELEESLNTTLNPAQQREMLLQQVKQDKLDIEALTKVHKSLEDNYETQKVRLAEIERELEGKDSMRLKKHKELRERGEHMDVFIASFEEKAAEIRANIDQIQEKIILGLDCLSNSITDLNFDELDKILSDSSEQQTVEGMNKKHEILLGQLERLKNFKNKYETELRGLKEKQIQMTEEIESYRNVDGKSEEFLQRKAALESECDSLKSVLETTNNAVIEAQTRRNQLKKKLNENEAYHEVQKLEREIDELRTKNDDLEEMMNSSLSTQQIENLMSTVKELVTKRNEEIKQSLKKNA